MAGFPVHGIPGHDNAGAHERQTWQGVLAILANWSFWTTVAWVALLPVKQVQRKHRVMALFVAVVTTMIAGVYFVGTLD